MNGNKKEYIELFADGEKNARIPKFVRGGIVGRPTLAKVGDIGKEIVVPLDNASLAKSLIKVDIANLEPFKNMIKVFDDFLNDERINDDVRNEYGEKVYSIVKGLEK